MDKCSLWKTLIGATLSATLSEREITKKCKAEECLSTIDIHLNILGVFCS